MLHRTRNDGDRQQMCNENLILYFNQNNWVPLIIILIFTMIILTIMIMTIKSSFTWRDQSASQCNLSTRLDNLILVHLFIAHHHRYHHHDHPPSWWRSSSSSWSSFTVGAVGLSIADQLTGQLIVFRSLPSIVLTNGRWVTMCPMPDGKAGRDCRETRSQISCSPTFLIAPSFFLLSTL